MNIYKLYSKYFLSLLVSMLAMVAVTSCSDDDQYAGDGSGDKLFGR